MRRPLTDSEIIGGCVGALVALAVAGVLGSIRGEVAHANAALVLALVTVVAATVGGRWAGGAAALGGALGFDFFLTRPYQSLAIKDGGEIITTILLFVVGLVVGEIVSQRAHAERGRQDGVEEVGGLHRVARLVADGAPALDVIDAVEAEVARVVRVPGCSFTTVRPTPTPPEMDATGRIDAPYVHVEGGFALPAAGIAIEVRTDGRTVGWLTCDPPTGLVGVSGDRRRTALVLADLLGASLGRAARAAA